MKKHSLTIGDISARTGLTPSAIRHYESESLVFPTATKAGSGVINGPMSGGCRFVMIAQQLGFTLAEIRTELSTLPLDRAPTKADWTRISRRFGQVLDARIDRMTALRERLDSCIGCGCLSLQSCQLYNPEDRAARAGAGPRYLMGDRPLDE